MFLCLYIYQIISDSYLSPPEHKIEHLPRLGHLLVSVEASIYCVDASINGVEALYNHGQLLRNRVKKLSFLHGGDVGETLELHTQVPEGQVHHVEIGERCWCSSHGGNREWQERVCVSRRLWNVDRGMWMWALDCGSWIVDYEL